MTHNTSKAIYLAAEAHKTSNTKTLDDCAGIKSEFVKSLFEYFLQVFKKYNGQDFKIVDECEQDFAVAFYGEICGEKAFFHLTRHADRFAYIDELNDTI